MKMKKAVLCAVSMLGVVCLQNSASASEVPGQNKSAALYKQHCAVCHPDGGNIVNPKKTLHKKDREANQIKSTKDIVRLLRNPGPGMIKFDEKTISNKEAEELAEYIVKTFSK